MMLRKLLSKLQRQMASSSKVQFLFQKKIKMKMHQRKMLAATFLQCLVTFGMLFQVKMIFNPKKSTIKSILREFPKTSSPIFVFVSHLDNQLWILLWPYIECEKSWRQLLYQLIDKCINGNPGNKSYHICRGQVQYWTKKNFNIFIFILWNTQFTRITYSNQLDSR